MTINSFSELPIAIFDNKGQSFDRYSVIYKNERESSGLFACRSMSERPMHPQGIGQMCSAAIGDHLGVPIQFLDLPVDCRKLVLSDLQLGDGHA